ncbi:MULTISPECIES: hypothetical protein [unclassified Enterococcus]|uniref:hypothetical protein n=1 Tax=unclassified Enterococcus TaxID=2608891 RepID=UPI001CE10D19|nr:MULTISPECIES: hypothetical protein [unclassified Enterococcus]MCA5014592.1 hypothetical protein [Enterococcus sp. S23]MCA5017845.1 hypothetical protein [Enterococcus sp. S22(2020)]
MKKVLKFSLSLFVFGATFFLFGTQSEAASLEQMKNSIEAGEGMVYNPVSNGILTEESSIKFVSVLEEALAEGDTETVTEDMLSQAFQETSSSSDLEVEEAKEPQTPTIAPMVATIPGIYNINYLTKEYPSNPFTGTGWQYSGMRFAFKDTVANPFFGLRAEKDSFNFVYQSLGGTYPHATVYVPANGKWIYSPSVSKPQFGSLTYVGYFSTYNPVYGCRYFIY